MNRVTSYLTTKQQREDTLQRYRKKQQISTRYVKFKNKDYTEEEDSFILADNGLSMMEKAKRLGRSYAAISGRRQRLVAAENGDITKTWRRRKKKVISRNRIKCKKCGDVIESGTVHDFKTCRCGACSVDGGHEYLRRLGNPDDWEDMSEYKQV